ncbi:MAG: hypothetical protein F2813_02055 [Actinobacteria bacterium]|uniref:Unannotated protein n=1 Tax=freshwater metagenome TaxID=449393 RepID=A0A6J5ZHS5_9ZZZZ|nr:hypothetical protein [Actinomycetota bacterium]
MASRLRQNLREFETKFRDEIKADRERRLEIHERAETRIRVRRLDRQHRLGTLRFGMLVLLLIATAVVVTVAMFETLYIVMG